MELHGCALPGDHANSEGGDPGRPNRREKMSDSELDGEILASRLYPVSLKLLLYLII